ncbi:mitochondrial fission 1 protein [Neocallimastix californiae]|uniref:Mitochondrial fission 1 protein n=1 Tax=Neocallimastix californiae TaxID=1754190 RepID=A0A1Y2ELX8_9FUNG|nr:mitochondrial fission 1 protein [Neocallimastix californiae]|eukprot:ORY72542.1 mitochondrial fission 1 protein [Neocallimastix californiae]
MVEKNLPYIEEIDEPLLPEAVEEAYKKESNPTSQIKFNYAWANIKSDKKADQEKGIKILYEIYKENPGRSRECKYYLAIGEYRLGHYREARNYIDSLLEFEPKNQQFLNFKKIIDSKVQDEGILGIAIVGGIAIATGTLLIKLLKK